MYVSEPESLVNEITASSFKTNRQEIRRTDMGVLDKFLSAIRLNDDYDEEDDFFDEEDDFEDEKPKAKKRFSKKIKEDPIDDDFEDDYEDLPKPKKPAKKEPTKKAADYAEPSYDEPKYTQPKYAQPKTTPVKPSRSYAAQQESKVTPLRRRSSSSNPMEVCVIKPTSMEDNREIADTLIANCTVVLNLEGIDVELAQRIIDFVSGACYAKSGNLQKVSSYIFILTPAGVEISGDIQDILNGAAVPAMRTEF